jgi:hypothetical protein
VSYLFPRESVADPLQDSQKRFAVGHIAEDVLACIPARHDVMQCTRKLNA